MYVLQKLAYGIYTICIWINNLLYIVLINTLLFIWNSDDYVDHTDIKNKT